MCLPLRYTLQQAPFLVHSVLGLVSNRTGYEILDCLTVETIGTLDFFCKADLECRAEFSKHLIPFKIQQSEVRRNNFVLQSLWLLKKSLYSLNFLWQSLLYLISFEVWYAVPLQRAWNWGWHVLGCIGSSRCPWPQRTSYFSFDAQCSDWCVFTFVMHLKTAKEQIYANNKTNIVNPRFSQEKWMWWTLESHFDLFL